MARGLLEGVRRTMTTSSPLPSSRPFSKSLVSRFMLVVAAMVSVLATGCNSSLNDEVLKSAKDDLSCEESEIRVIVRGPLGLPSMSTSGSSTPESETELVVAEGCGQQATYACTRWNNPLGASYSCCNMATQGCGAP